MFRIAYFNRRLGKPIEAKFDTLAEAKRIANEIFLNLGIVVGIEECTK